MSVLVVLVILSAGRLPSVRNSATGYLHPDWTGAKRDLVFRFASDVPADIRRVVTEAALEWNSLGVGWTLREQRDSAPFDILVRYDRHLAGGRFEALSGDDDVITQATITIGEIGLARLSTALHEFGHAFRLGHEPECGNRTTKECLADGDSPCQRNPDVMAAHLLFAGIGLSDRDRERARISAGLEPDSEASR
jgi:hypothetical protein